MRITINELSFRFSHMLPMGKRITGVAVAEDGSLVCQLGDTTDTRHRYNPHKKYPQFCECGYSEHELLVHLPKPTANS